MKSRSISSLIICALVLSSVASALGQQARPDNAGISQLQEEVEKLEAVERDPSTSPEVRELNGGFLRERRQQLYAQLRGRTAALRRYLNDLKGTLTQEEVQVVERSLQKLEQESASLAAALRTGASEQQDGTNAETTNAATSASAAPAVAIRNAAYVPAERTEQRPFGPAVNESTTTAPRPDAALTNAAPSDAASPIPLQNAPQPCSGFKKNSKTFSLLDQYTCDLAERTVGRKAAGKSPIDLTGQQFFDITVILIGQKLRSNFLVEAEEARVDKQVEAPSSSSGSTSLVTKGGTPAVLGFA